MTRTAEAAERGRQEYEESNPDPRFRPSVGRLMNKLRTLPQFEDPRAAAYLIDDQIWYHLFHGGNRPRDEPQPALLLYLLKQIAYYWSTSIGAGGISENANRLQNIFTGMGQNRYTEDAVPKSEALALDDPKIKQVVRSIIFQHTLDDPITIICACGKKGGASGRWEFAEQWATHVRVLIWKELTNGISHPDVSSNGQET